MVQVVISRAVSAINNNEFLQIRAVDGSCHNFRSGIMVDFLSSATTPWSVGLFVQRTGNVRVSLSYGRVQCHAPSTLAGP